MKQIILDISSEIDCSKEPHIHSRVWNRTQRITTNTGIMVPGLNTRPNQWKTPLCHTDASHGNTATLNSPGEVYPWIPAVCHLKSPSQQSELRTRTNAVLWMCFLFWREHVAVPPYFSRVYLQNPLSTCKGKPLPPKRCKAVRKSYRLKWSQSLRRRETREEMFSLHLSTSHLYLCFLLKKMSQLD